MQVTGLTEHGVTAALLVFGLALTVGSTLGGKLGDHHLEQWLVRIFAMLILIFLALTQAIYHIVPTFIVIFAWGALGFAVVPLLQTLIVDQASAAPNLASTLNQGAFNLGNASGAWIGSMALRRGANFADLPWITVGLGVAAFLLTWWGTHHYARVPQRDAVSV
jgi:DHA1 family inner membrane transport protein